MQKEFICEICNHKFDSADERDEHEFYEAQSKEMIESERESYTDYVRQRENWGDEQFNAEQFRSED